MRVQEIDNYAIKMAQMERMDLKMLCRDVIRRELYQKHNDDFCSFQKAILNLEIPGDLIDFLQFIEYDK